MKTVSQAFLDQINADSHTATVEVSYKRRYWQQSTNAYIWEASWTVIDNGEIQSLTPIVSKLDTVQLNQFKISNLTLKLHDRFGKWMDKNRDGIFGPDSASGNGYEPFWTKFRIRYSVTLASGSTEEVALFVGLAVDFNFDGQKHSMIIRIDGLESLLQKANAENVSTSVTAESIGTGNGSDTEFTTANNGASVDRVMSDGIEKKLGVDYSLSQLNDPDLPAKVTFTVAPAASVAITADYKYWKQNQKIEDLVSDLLDEAGIATGDQEISPVLFQSILNQIFSQSSQAEFEAGTNTNTDTGRSPGDLFPDYDDSGNKQIFDDFSGSYDWTSVIDLGVAPAGITAGELVFPNGNLELIRKSCDKVLGVWQAKIKNSSASSYGFTWVFVGDSVISGGAPANLNDAYSLRFLKTVSGDFNMQLRYSQTPLAEVGVELTGSYKTFRVSRTPTGRLRVYVDGFKQVDIIHQSGPQSNTYIYFDHWGNGVTTVDDVYEPSDQIIMTHQSQNLDAIVTPVSWGILSSTRNPAGSTISFRTRSSTDAISWDAWVAATPGSVIASALKRYLQVEAKITNNSDTVDDPSISDYSVQYQTSSLGIKLANFTGKTVYDAIKDFGAFADYEFGFDEEENFFFRAKTVDTGIDETIKNGKNLISLAQTSRGYNLVYSEVVANYGSFRISKKIPSDFKESSSSRFLENRLTLDSSAILINDDVDVATQIALKYLNVYGMPKRRFKAKTKIFPHIDLSDTVQLTYESGKPDKIWFIGDTSARLGQNDIHLFGGPNFMADKLLTKVVGLKHDPEKKISEFDLEEILI